MCDPVSLAVTGLALGAVSTGVSTYGAISSGNAAAASARYNAQVAQQNATLARSQGVAAAYKTSQEGAQRLGMIRAVEGASGVDVSSGSALDVQLATAQTTGMDEANQRYNAALQANGYRNQSQLDTAQASSAQTAGYLSGASTFLGGASQFAGQWASLQAMTPKTPTDYGPTTNPYGPTPTAIGTAFVVPSVTYPGG